MRAVVLGCLLIALQSQQAPVFKGRIDLSRLDVLVIDNKTGKPVTDLSAPDFTILEDDARQQITLFLRESWTAQPSPVTPEQVVRGGQPADAGNRRVFLFIPELSYRVDDIGIEGPIKPLEGVVSFIRERLMPNDLVAVLAYNRVVPLTTDHERVAQIVERLRKSYREISYQIYLLASASMRNTKCVEIGAVLQSEIDAVFQPPADAGLQPRSILPLLFGTEAFKQIEHSPRLGEMCRPWNRIVSGHNLFKVHAGLELLRPIAGQKHLVSLTTGFWLPVRLLGPRPSWIFTDASDEARLAARANDAGVAIDIIDTSGTAPLGRSNMDQLLSSRNLAATSGGTFSSVRTGREALGRIDDATRHAYTLGYTPANPEMDGRYRKVQVKIDRRDVTVVFRHGYTARAETPPLDVRAVLTATRLREAAATDVEHMDIRVTLAGATTTGSGADARVQVDLRIDGSRLGFTRSGDRREGEITVLVLCGDKDGKPVGRLQHQLRMSLDDAKYERAVTEGMPYTMTVAVTGRAADVKVLVYDYETDLVGSATGKVR